MRSGYTSIRIEEIDPAMIGYSVKKSKEVSQDKPKDEWDFSRVKGTVLDPVTFETAPLKTPMQGKANLIKECMEETGVELETVASYIGTEESNFKDMLAEDIFEFEDVLKALHACGYQMLVKRPQQPLNSAKVLQLKDFLDDEELTRMSNVKDLIEHRRRKRYEELMAEVKAMQEKYGFEDI